MFRGGNTKTLRNKKNQTISTVKYDFTRKKNPTSENSHILIFFLKRKNVLRLSNLSYGRYDSTFELPLISHSNYTKICDYLFRRWLHVLETNILKSVSNVTWRIKSSSYKKYKNDRNLTISYGEGVFL